MIWSVDRSTLISKNVPNEYHTKTVENWYLVLIQMLNILLLRSNAVFSQCVTYFLVFRRSNQN